MSFFKKFFCLLSLCSSDPIFRSPFLLFASRISTIFAIYAVRYRRFASVNFVAYLRGIFCFAAPILFQLLSSACFGVLLEFIRDGSTFAVSLVLWQGRRLRCVAGAIRGVLFHEEAVERAE